MTDLITRELMLPTDLESAWQAITDPARLCDWLAEAVEFDPSPGGDARFLVDGELREGWVEELTAPADGAPGRFAFWWQAGEATATRVSLELVERPDGVRLRIEEARPLEIPQLVGPTADGGGTAGPGPGAPTMLLAAA